MIVKLNALLVALLCFFTVAGYGQRKSAKVITHISAPNKLTASIAAGQLVYKKICLTCHQADGGGVQNMNPPLIKTTYVSGDKAKIIGIVLNGFKEQVEIDDQVYHNVMPAFDYLKDQEIADVLTYVRNSFGNKASAVTVGEVARLRIKK